VVSVAPAAGRVERAWAVLAEVPDPEIPVISVRDLGIVRDVGEAGPTLEVVLTPTYSGCPATEVIAGDVRAAIEAAGLGPVRITQRLAPAWTTDWISDEGLRKLREYGIAPPGAARMPAASSTVTLRARGVECPRCGSASIERLAAFGSTPCKALYRCLDCREPFDHFKTL
jgi:ring-1,2-phenylacetyl-CoA epoxidase subunit PaaD